MAEKQTQQKKKTPSADRNREKELKNAFAASTKDKLSVSKENMKQRRDIGSFIGVGLVVPRKKQES